MDGKTEAITTIFVPLDFLNAMVYPSIRKPIEEVWDGMMNANIEDEKDKGLPGVYELAQAKWLNRTRYGDYQYIVIDQEILNKVLKGEIKTIEELKKIKENILTNNNYDSSSFEYTMLYYTKKEDDADKFLTYIETIFINK